MSKHTLEKLNRPNEALEKQLSENEVIFVNADALVSPFFPKFVSNIIPLLIRQNKQLVVSKAALDALKRRFSEVKGSLLAEDISTETHAYIGLYVLNKLISRKLLCYYSHEVVDGMSKPTNELIHELSDDGVLVITQNEKLYQENEKVAVRTLVEGGYIEKFEKAIAEQKVIEFKEAKPKPTKVNVKSEKVVFTQRMIRIAQLALLIVLSSALIVGGTLAYLTAENSKTNTISVGEVGVVIDEPGVNNKDVPWGVDTKPVYLAVSADSIDGVVRAIIVPEFMNENGEYVSITGASISEPISNRIELGDITLVLDSNWADNWFYKDGFFYYKTIVPAGTSTKKLLAGVVLTDDTEEMRTKYQSISVQIEVFAEIIQPNAEAVELWGVNLTSSGNVAP